MRELLNVQKTVASVSHFSNLSVSVKSLSEPEDPFELTLFLPQRQPSLSNSVLETETEIQTVNFERLEEIYRNKHTVERELAISNSVDHKLVFSDDSSDALMEGNDSKQKKKTILAKRKTKHEKENTKSIPMQKTTKLRFNPKASAAKFVIDNTVNSKRRFLQEQEEELNDASEIAVTPISKPSNFKEVHKRIKGKIEKANEEFVRNPEKH